MAYVGVEFHEKEGSIGLVHSSWLTPLKNDVFWPPYKTTNAFSKALTTAEEPNEETWRITAIKRTFFQCDDYEKAQKKLRKCEETSDVQTSDYENKKLKRKAKKNRLISDSSNDGDGSDVDCMLTRPPVFKHNFKQKARTNQNFGNSGTASQTPNSQWESTPGTSKDDIHAESHVIFAAHKGISRNISNSEVPTSKSNTVNSVDIEKIFHELKKVREELKEIKAIIKQSRTSSAPVLASDIPVEFPINSIENFQVFEDYLNDIEKQNQLASYLSTFGGIGVTAQVNRILRFLITNRLGSYFNYAGQRNNKRPFGTTKLKSIIISAVQLKSPGSTQNDIETSIKIWLKHSKQRMDKKIPKQAE